MEQRHLKITKTARYFMIGKPGPEINYVWFVLHGYGQHAGYFLRNFQILERKDTVIIAPEGLSRFYLEGSGGRVGASWMTKEDRETEIEDHVNWLDQLTVHLFPAPQKLTIAVLGFSQGTATACRWLERGKIDPQFLVLWGGGAPPDLDTEMFDHKENLKCIALLKGNADEIFNMDSLNESFERLNKIRKPESVIYEGGHKILQEPLMVLEKEIRND